MGRQLKDRKLKEIMIPKVRTQGIGYG